MRKLAITVTGKQNKRSVRATSEERIAGVRQKQFSDSVYADSQR